MHLFLKTKSANNLGLEESLSELLRELCIDDSEGSIYEDDAQYGPAGFIRLRFCLGSFDRTFRVDKDRRKDSLRVELKHLRHALLAVGFHQKDGDQ